MRATTAACPSAKPGGCAACLTAASGQLTWLEYKDETQGFGTPAARIDFQRQMVQFLDANIGPGSDTAR